MYGVPRLLLSAVRGGTGKTTLAIGIAAALRRQGRRVAVFKKGPDFIDAGWLGAAAARPCYNLDPFLMDDSVILRSFAVHTADADAAVIEGNRGLYDGVDESGTYSTARLAKLLHTPVVLIVDCTKCTGTVGAIVLGLKLYDPEVDLSAVILNNVSTARHERVIRLAVEQTAGIPVVGALPRLSKHEFPERHMGLLPFHEHPAVAEAIDTAADLVARYVDLGALIEIAGRVEAVALPAPNKDLVEPGSEQVHPRIGVIQDRAFQFYYPENIDALEREGARIIKIDALSDRELPEIDALYIGGGFPETQAAGLAANETFSRSLKENAEAGLPVYAECGGLIYLGRSLRVGEKTYPMTNVLPADFVLEKRPQAHGYTVIEVTRQNPFFDTGVVLKGHEFHYSRIVNTDELTDTVFGMRRGVGINGKKDGLIKGNVLGTYTHLHALAAPEWAMGMVRKASEFAGLRRKDMQ